MSSGGVIDYFGLFGIILCLVLNVLYFKKLFRFWRIRVVVILIYFCCFLWIVERFLMVLGRSGE